MMHGTFFMALTDFFKYREHREKILYGNGELCYSFLNLQIGNYAETPAFLENNQILKLVWQHFKVCHKHQSCETEKPTIFI